MIDARGSDYEEPGLLEDGHELRDLRAVADDAGLRHDLPEPFADLLVQHARRCEEGAARGSECPPPGGWAQGSLRLLFRPPLLPGGRRRRRLRALAQLSEPTFQVQVHPALLGAPHGLRRKLPNHGLASSEADEHVVPPEDGEDLLLGEHAICVLRGLELLAEPRVLCRGQRGARERVLVDALEVVESDLLSDLGRDLLGDPGHQRDAGLRQHLRHLRGGARRRVCGELRKDSGEEDVLALLILRDKGSEVLEV
mmetsp:Transcript_47447/g.119576  ORF Transcript_47447/g.119576 Transcript_47447/m.119576 type:complete len:254 (-) Transcript_47447:219-980(-)